MLSTGSIGVHFTSTHAYIVCLEKNMFRTRLKEFTRVDLDKNSTMAQRLEVTGAYLTQFIQEKGLAGAQVNVSFPAELSIVRQLTFPSSVRDDLSSTIKYSLEKYIPIRTEDLHFDFSVISEDKDKNTIKVLLCAAKKTDVKPFIDLAESMDTGISCVQMDAAAIAGFVCNDPELKPKTYPELYVFYADQNTLDFLFFRNGQYEYSRQIQVSGAGDDLTELMGKEIQRTVTKENFTSPVRTVVLCGTGITQAVYDHFGKDPQVNVKKHGFETYALPSEAFIPAVGLAMNGLVKKKGLQLNLLPAGKRKKVSRAPVYFMYILIFTAAGLGMLWGAGYLIQQSMVQKNIAVQLAGLENERIEIQDKKSEINRLVKEIKVVNRLKIEQVEINQVFNELSRIIPPTSWVKSFSFNMEKGVRIGGESENASALIPLLEESDLFENAVFLSAITKSRDGKDVFLIGCDIIRRNTVKQ